MAVLTENEIKRIVGKNNQKMTEFFIKRGQIITPSAKSYLVEKNIELKYLEDRPTEKKDKEKEVSKKAEVEEKNYKYTTVFGGKLDEKPEHMTHLYGNVLVFKDHKRIILRGKIDSLESKLMEAQLICQRNNMPKLIDDLEDILSFVRNIMRCEVLEEEVKDFKLIELTPEELREQSHYPKKYFGIGHECPSYTMGEVVIALNSIRSFVREVELSAYEAFKTQYGEVQRGDIIKALNRLSSVFWILIYRVRTDKYR